MNEIALAPAEETSAGSIAAAIVGARSALEEGEGRGATWQWDLASDRIEWDEGLHALFGHTKLITNAAWRAQRIHPKDRRRVCVSLQRATIVNRGAEWSEQYRFRRADGAYVAVAERAIVVSDDAGPRCVLGVITPHPGTGERP